MKKLLCFALSVITLFMAASYALADEASAEEQLAVLQEKYDQLLENYNELQEILAVYLGEDFRESLPEDEPEAEVVVPDGFVEDSFCDLTYVVPKAWDLRNEDYDEDDETACVRYYQTIEDGLLGPLDIEARDALATLRDLELAQILLLGEVDPTNGKEDKLDFLARTDLQSCDILEKEFCKVGGEDALRVKATVRSGVETLHYYFITDEYYYHFYFWPEGQESADEFEETITQVMDSVRITTE